MLRSVRNLSDELGVEKFKIYKFIKDNDLKVTRLGSSRVMYFDEPEAEKIIRAFTPETAARAAARLQAEAEDNAATGAGTGTNASAPGIHPDQPSISGPVNPSYEAVVRQLRQELAQKEQQLAVVNGQLASMTGALRNANDCVKRLSESTRNLTDSLRASQAMYLGAVKQIAEEQEKTRLLQGRIAEAEAEAEAEQRARVEAAAEEARREAARQNTETLDAIQRRKKAARTGRRPISRILDRLLRR